MGDFAQRLNTYCQVFHVSRRDRLRLIAHYPLFKLLWWADYGGQFTRAVARKIVPLFGRYNMTHNVVDAKGDAVPVRVSFNQNDFASFIEVFFSQGYSNGDFTIGSLVDLGANTGMASLYFLVKCPALQKVIVVEPNPNLLPKLRANLQPFLADKVVVEHAFVSGHKTAFLSLQLGDNHRHSLIASNETSIQVRNLSLAQLLDNNGLPEVDLLKMDIEGAEYSLLDQVESFRRCRRIVAEIHGSRADRDRFALSLERIGFKVKRDQIAEGNGCDLLGAERI